MQRTGDGPPYPLSGDKLQYAGACLHYGRYRSSAQYFSALRREHLRRGHEWLSTYDLEVKDGIRSCTRGIAPPRRAGPYDLAKVAALGPEFAAAPLHLEGPALPKQVAIVSAWWALREIEASLIRLSQVKLGAGTLGRPCGVGTLNLPCSKTDLQTLGKERTHGCACPSAACPVKALRELVTFAEVFKGTMSPTCLADKPLAPDSLGGFPTKTGMTATLVLVAAASGCKERITGHSPRVTGAQAMAAAQMALWRIQVFCRWGSTAVLGYIREAHLVCSEAIATEVLDTLSLQEMKGHVRARAQTKAPVGKKQLQEAMDEAVEQVAAEAAERLPDYLDEHLDCISARVHDKLRASMAASAVVVPAPDMEEHTFVVNLSPESGRLHLLGDATVTACGWQWGGDIRAELVHSRDGYKPCGRCFPTSKNAEEI